MNKAELIDEIAKVTCTKKEAGEASNQMTGTPRSRSVPSGFTRCSSGVAAHRHRA